MSHGFTALFGSCPHGCGHRPVGISGDGTRVVEQSEERIGVSTSGVSRRIDGMAILSADGPIKNGSNLFRHGEAS